MPVIKTNLLRFDFNEAHYRYEVEITSQCQLEPIHFLYLSDHLHSLVPNVLYSHPFLYSSVPLTSTSTQTHLPNGHKAAIKINQIQREADSVKVADILVKELMMLTKMLYSHDLQACFNPFEEYEEETKRKMPGWQVGAQSFNKGIVLRIIGVQLEMEEAGILESSEHLIDYYTGSFLLKQDIVRIDKELGLVHFRSGISKPRNSLRSIRLIQLSGYPLAKSISSFLERLKSTGKCYMQAWGIKFDSRFLDVTGNYLAVGSLGFREGVDRSLSEIVGPLSQYNFTYHYVRLFRAVKFDDILKASLFFFCEEHRRKEVTAFREGLQEIAARMNLEFQIKTIFFKNYEHLVELISIVNTQQNEEMVMKICLIFTQQPKDKPEKDAKNVLLQFLVQSCTHYHLISIESLLIKDQEQFEAGIYRNLSLIYTKCRLNPWRLKNIPFLSKPMMLASLHIQPTTDGSYSVAIVGTMNLFFTKFTAVHKIAQGSNLSIIVSQAMMECLELFNSKHKRYPQRVFLIRSDPDAQRYIDVAGIIEEARIRGSQLTYVTFCNNHGVRLYNQLDSNYLSKDTVKKIQVMLYTTINQELYLQMELESPPYRVRINPMEKDDPGFTEKVIELITKAALGGAGHTFGSGLGILDYSKKLNQYRNLNLTNWSHNLLEGVLVYL